MTSTSNVSIEGAESSPIVESWGLQKIAGIAALFQAAIYASAIVYFLLILDFTNVGSSTEMVELLVANEMSMYAMNLLAYVVFGVLLVVLVLALHQRLQAGSSGMMQAATAFGLIWAGLVIASGMIANISTAAIVDHYHTDPSQATTLWMAVNPVIEGLGGGNEIVGGLWTLLVSLVALRAAMLHRILNYFGIIVGTAGILSAIPMLGDIGGGVFGLTQLVWFVGIGIILLRSSNRSHSISRRD